MASFFCCLVGSNVCHLSWMAMPGHHVHSKQAGMASPRMPYCLWRSVSLKEKLPLQDMGTCKDQCRAGLRSRIMTGPPACFLAHNYRCTLIKMAGGEGQRRGDADLAPACAKGADHARPGVRGDLRLPQHPVLWPRRGQLNFKFD